MIFKKTALTAALVSAVMASGAAVSSAGAATVQHRGADIIKLQQCLLGTIRISQQDVEALDFNKDGVINSFDLSEACLSEIMVPAVTETALPEITLPEITTHGWMANEEIPFATVILDEPKVTEAPVVTTEAAVTTTVVTTTTEVTTTTAVTTTEAPVTTTVTTTAVKAPVKLEVDSILQNPELPKGCEITSLTMLLNHYGFGVSKMQLVDYMPKFNFYIIDDVLYGADFINTFPGNPKSSTTGCGCYTPCMVTTAEKFFQASGIEGYKLEDITGSDFDTILSYTDAGRPVMVWATVDMVEPEYSKEWTTPDGRVVQWNENEHCFVITGYDRNTNTVYVNDPLRGKVSYSMSVFKLRYNQMGKYAAVISGNGIQKPGVPGTDSPVQKTYSVGDTVTYTGLVYYSAAGGKSAEVSGTYEISEIIDDESKPYRIRLGTAGWVPYDFES